MCSGNHDIDREVVRRDAYVEKGLSEILKSREKINQFIEQHIAADVNNNIPPPFERLSSFYRSMWPATTLSSANPFFRNHQIQIDGTSIGISCFNSAWRSTGEPNDVDYGHLILGERVIDLASQSLPEADLRIAVFHHPLTWLSHDDQVDVESELTGAYDILTCGHIHRANPEQKTSVIGDVIFSQSGCLYQSRTYFNGYSTMAVDLDERTAEFQLWEYSDQRREFVAAGRIADQGKFSVEFTTRTEGRALTVPRIIRQVRNAVRSQANGHISIAGNSGPLLDIDKHFACPELVEGSTAGATMREAAHGTAPQLDIRRLLQDDKSVVIVGRPGTGKTSLAHYICVMAADGCCDKPRIPLLGAFGSLKKGDRPHYILVRDYAAAISNGTIGRKIVENESCLIIVDNVDIEDRARLAVLKELIGKFKNIRWILIVNDQFGVPNYSALVSSEFTSFLSVAIKDLSRSSIRKLSASWIVDQDDSEKTDQTYRSVIEQLQRTSLPRSGYIVSLVLWALQNKSQGELLNEAVLVQNVIDFILDKMDYRGALRSEFDFTSKNAVLQHLAFEMRDRAVARGANDIVTIVIQFLKKKGLRYDAGEIVAGFIECGILQQVGEEVVFKYDRFQDFFVAGYFRDNENALMQAMEGKKWIDFARELDLYTGRFRHEARLLPLAQKILKETSQASGDLNAQNVYAYLTEGSSAMTAGAQLRKMRRQRLSAAQVDKILEAAEQELVKARSSKALAGKTKDNSRLNIFYERQAALNLYSQFIRNLEFADREDKEAHLATCIDHWEQSVFLYLSVTRQIFAKIRDHDQTSPEGVIKAVELIESLVKEIMPAFIALDVYNELASEKLADLLDDIVDKATLSTLRGLICAFVLLEIRPELVLRRIKEQYKSFNTWTAGAVTHRLYNFYRSRPLSEKLRPGFETLVAELETLIGRLKDGRASKGAFLQNLHKHAFRENYGK